MTLRKIWDPKPLAERFCGGCGQPIYRNLARLDGEPWHYGELRDSKHGLVKATHYCRDCQSYLTRGKVSYMMINDERWRTCGICGSTNIIWLKRESTPPTVYSNPHLMLLYALEEKGIRCLSEYPLPFMSAGEQDPKGCRMDIYIPPGLCVEVDDSKLHDPDSDRERDQMLLREHEIKTIRFTTDEVRRNLPECVARVQEALV